MIITNWVNLSSDIFRDHPEIMDQISMLHGALLPKLKKIFESRYFCFFYFFFYRNIRKVPKWWIGGKGVIEFENNFIGLKEALKTVAVVKGRIVDKFVKADEVFRNENEDDEAC